MTIIAGKSSKKFRVFYCDSADITGYDSYGDVIPESALESDGIWKQLRIVNPLSNINLVQESFKTPQNSDKILSDKPQAGLKAPESMFEILLHTALKTAHLAIMKTGFGKYVEKTGSTTAATVASDTSFTLTSAINFSIGDMIKVTDASDNFKGYDVIENLSGVTVTLQNGITGLIATDKIINQNYFNMQEVTDNKYYHLFIETEIGNFFVLWNKPSVGLTTVSKEILKLSLKFAGGNFFKTTKTYADLDTTTLESQVLKHEIGNFNKVIVGADTCRKVVTSVFTITRENTRIDSQCTQDEQGNGGVFNDAVVATLDLQLLSYPEILTNYEAGTSFNVLAYNENLCISGKGVVDSRVMFAENNNMVQPTVKVELNAIDGSPLRVVL